MTINIIISISEVLFQKYCYYVPILEIGHESQTFYREEIDEDLVPAFILPDFEEPIQIESASNVDALGKYYLVIQVETGNVKPYEVRLVNDEVVPNFAEMEDGK